MVRGAQRESKLIGGALLASLAACVAPTPVTLTADGARVRVAIAAQVAGCCYLGDFVSGTIGYKLPAPWATNQVMNLASSAGATHVVFDDAANGVNSDIAARGIIVGKGYRCE